MIHFVSPPPLNNVMPLTVTCTADGTEVPFGSIENLGPTERHVIEHGENHYFVHGPGTPESMEYFA